MNKANLTIQQALDALIAAREMCDYAHGKFDWGRSALDAKAIQQLNTAPGLIREAITALDELTSDPDYFVVEYLERNGDGATLTRHAIADYPIWAESLPHVKEYRAALEKNYGLVKLADSQPAVDKKMIPSQCVHPRAALSVDGFTGTESCSQCGRYWEK